MPGMGGNNVTISNSIVVSLFRHSVYATALYWIIGLALAFLLIATVTRRLGRFNLSADGLAEPRARTVLRIGFGFIWLFDGILQFQPGMPIGLANDVVRPTVAGAPSFLHPLMYDAIHLWNSHPIALATGTAWIQVGIGLALICSNGVIGRWAGATAAGWAALIWLIGNGAGGAFASGASILFGWPGATLFYFVAAVWIALSPRYFAQHFSRFTLRFVALVLVVGAVLQCLPSAGFWHGGNANALAGMSQTMTQTAQPHVLAWVVRHLGDLAGDLGGGFNIIVILWLLACAAGLWRATRQNVNWPFVTLAVGCLYFWVVGEDVAIFGGVGTDINSLIPLAFLTWCARPAWRAVAPVPRRLPEEFRSSTGAVVAAFASAMVVFSVISMFVASVSSAETTLFLAQNGSVAAVNAKATPFTLTDQYDQSYKLGEHKGRYTLLTFLDPVCWTDCPLLAAQLKQVRQDLGPSAPIDIVVVAANPENERLPELRHFITIHQMSDVKNFYFVTGPLATMRTVWKTWAISVSNVAGDAMSIHSDYMYVISPTQHVKWIIPDDPLSGVAGQASAETEILTLLHKSGVA